MVAKLPPQSVLGMDRWCSCLALAGQMINEAFLNGDAF